VGAFPSRILQHHPHPQRRTPVRRASIPSPHADRQSQPHSPSAGARSSKSLTKVAFPCAAVNPSGYRCSKGAFFNFIHPDQPRHPRFPSRYSSKCLPRAPPDASPEPQSHSPRHTAAPSYIERKRGISPRVRPQQLPIQPHSRKVIDPSKKKPAGSLRLGLRSGFEVLPVPHSLLFIFNQLLLLIKRLLCRYNPTATAYPPVPVTVRNPLSSISPTQPSLHTLPKPLRPHPPIAAIQQKSPLPREHLSILIAPNLQPMSRRHRAHPQSRRQPKSPLPMPHDSSSRNHASTDPSTHPSPSWPSRNRGKFSTSLLCRTFIPPTANAESVSLTREPSTLTLSRRCYHQPDRCKQQKTENYSLSCGLGEFRHELPRTPLGRRHYRDRCRPDVPQSDSSSSRRRRSPPINHLPG